MQLELDDVGEARKMYKQVLSIISRIEEKNIWVHATAATAAIVNNEQELAIQHLTEVKNCKPTAENLSSIERGLETVRQKLNLDQEIYNSYTGVLR